MVPFLILADAAAVATDWKTWALFFAGMIGMRAAAWIATWFDGKGAEWIKAELEKLQAKMNQNSVLSQIQADDACVKILESVIPLVLKDAADDVKAAVASGDFKTIPWKVIAEHAWALAEPQIKGGANDYLKQSSFADGKVLAEMVMKKYFAKKQVDAATPAK